MGIRLIPSDTFKTKVTYTLKDENGKDEKQELVAKFKRLPTEQVKDFFNSGKHDAEMVREVLVGWDAKDLVTGDVVPYSEDVRDALFTQSGVASSFIMAFFENVGAVRAKN